MLHTHLPHATLRQLCCLLVATIALATQAQKQIASPLQFVNADSVVIWLSDPANLSASALNTDKHLHERALAYEPMRAKSFKMHTKQWDNTSAAWIGQGYPCHHWTPEPTNVANGIAQAALLFAHTADSRYTDAIERATFNYLLPLISTPGELSFERRIAAQAVLNATGYLYATDAAGLYVNLFINNTTHVKTNTHDFIVDQITALPYEGRLKVRISGLKKGRTPLTLRIRIPDWATRQNASCSSYRFCAEPQPLPTIYVNGRDERIPVENGYYVIHRKWNNGDEVYLDFPTDFFRISSTEASTKHEPCTAWQRGPIIYGYCTNTVYHTLPDTCHIEATQTLNHFGHPLHTIELKNNKGESETHHLQPIIDGATSTCIQCVAQ